MDQEPLKTPVQFLRGCGEQRAELLKVLGLHTVEDLLFFLPRDVLDLSHVTPPAELTDDTVHTVHGTVVDVDGRNLSRGRTLSSVLLECGDDFVRGTWFNQAWVLRRFQHGMQVLFSGKPKRRSGRWEFSHPQIQWLEAGDSDVAGAVLPRYRLTEGLRMYEIRKIVREAVERYAHHVVDRVPEEVLQEAGLPVLQEAVRQLHLPADVADYETGRRRILFDDLFEFQLGLALRRREWKRGRRAIALPVTPKIDARIRALFPFDFTDGQNKAVKEVAADLADDRAMHRLLQADVGAGKTAIAMYAMLTAVAAGVQTVLMAPTEILATQHWETIDEALARSRVTRRLLTGQLTAAQRRRVLEEISTGEVQLVVGTQAVIQEDVNFHRLGLAVIDEQHRFGVAQRARFSTGGVTPHVLVMTATPIPRSLTLTQFGDLDLTVISELPPGRQPVSTSRVRGPKAREKAWDFLRRQLRKGRQAYVVCPRIDSSGSAAGAERDPRELLPFDQTDASTSRQPPPAEEQPLPGEIPSTVDAGSATQVFADLTSGELKDFRVGLVHGQLDSQSKARAMDAFRNGETQVLVSTTVIEVGVDVPDATVMVVMEADRFGLSQLHQLRGRIGRGRHRSYCFLFSDEGTPEGEQRLAALESTTDGFRIAEADFELRGPGDVLGTRQHGELPLRVASLVRDREILEQAREVAFELVRSGRFDRGGFGPLRQLVLERFGELMELPHGG